MRTLLARLQSLLPNYRRRERNDIAEELAALEQIAGRGKLGNLTLIGEDAHAALSFPLLDHLAADLRFAFRSLKRDRSFTLVSVLSLALTLSANLALFGLMDALLWRQLPVGEPDRLVAFENSSRSYFGYSEFSKRSGAALQDVLAQSSTSSSLIETGSRAETADVAFVSGNYFSALRVQPQLGRLIQPSDGNLRNSSRVAVLSNRYWRSIYAGRSDVLHRSLYIRGARFEVAGVAPDEFFGLEVGEAPDIWIPIAAHPAVFPHTETLTNRNENWLQIFGRLREGVSIPQAEAMLAPVSLEIDIERSGSVPTAAERRKMLQDPIHLEPAAKGLSYLRNRFSRPLHVVFAMLAATLLLSCVNVISLQIARSDERRSEFAVRLALGASRFRIIRQCMVETLVIAGASMCAALLLFRPVAQALLAFLANWAGEPARLAIVPDANLASFMLALYTAVALLSGLLPAIHSSRKSVQIHSSSRTAAKALGRSPRTLIRAVSATQIAISLVLITGTCLFVLSLRQLLRFDGGIRRDGLYQVEVDPMLAGYSGERAVRIDEAVCSRIASLPGISRASFTQTGIYAGRNFDVGFHTETTDGHGLYDYVGPGFFSTAGTVMLAGRDFTAHDNGAAQKVVIVNQSLARRFFPNSNALGQNLYIGEAGRRTAYRVVGVIHDLRANPRYADPTWYFAALQSDVHPFSTRFIVRLESVQSLSRSALSSAIHLEDSNLRIEAIDSADALLNGRLDSDRLMARLAWGFGILACILASAGIYGLLSFDVTRRTPEIGIRTALGARRTDIAGLILIELSLVIAAGLSFGAVAAFLLAGIPRNLLFGISVHDPRIEVLAALILSAVACIAAALPARRAARLDPMRALRSE